MLIGPVENVFDGTVQVPQDNFHLAQGLGIERLCLLKRLVRITGHSRFIMAQTQLFETLFPLGSSKQLPWRIAPRPIAGKDPIWPTLAGRQIGLDISRCDPVTLGLLEHTT